MADMISSNDRIFNWLAGLLIFLAAVILGSLYVITKTWNDFLILQRLTASLVVPYMGMVLLWFWSMLTPTEEVRISLKLVAWSMLSFIFMYYVEVFSILILLRQISTYPTLSAFVLMGIIALMSYFPYRRIMLRYRAVTLNLPFWTRGILLVNLPCLVGILVAFGLIIGPLLML